jgi:hypothetical protein
LVVNCCGAKSSVVEDVQGQLVFNELTWELWQIKYTFYHIHIFHVFTYNSIVTKRMMRATAGKQALRFMNRVVNFSKSGKQKSFLPMEFQETSTNDTFVPPPLLRL